MIGSRSKYRAMEARDHYVDLHPELAESLTFGDNATAAKADLIVIATPWDSAATMAPGVPRRPQGEGRRLDGQ